MYSQRPVRLADGYAWSADNWALAFDGRATEAWAAETPAAHASGDAGDVLTAQKNLYISAEAASVSLAGGAVTVTFSPKLLIRMSVTRSPTVFVATV